MSEDLLDEITSINSIYGEITLESTNDEAIFALTLPSHPEISLRVEFPHDYPSAPPSILGTQHTGDRVAKGDGQDLVEHVRVVLADIYIPGSPCIFDLIEESGQRLPRLDADAASQEYPDAIGVNDRSREAEIHVLNDSQPDDDFPPPTWTLSDPITEKKSLFLARCTPVTSTQEAHLAIAHLLNTDKRAAKATHNISAWRIRSAANADVKVQDCDDDGETAAGGRLLHLLELVGVWNVLVVVSRWYGGVKLGPDRFRLINQVARDAVVKGGFVVDTTEGKSKGKGKK
ncbi:hypothetical protein B0A48_00982 [Cryoendolithus antarcticus]|uniref:RWD domain-containing protein n=1 Tax=Cryoendolithus antarcticus TaxID=1507870 RepID=A0A1V8TRW9_9PEZI|nr:hypothetical protein B0A48_00982 [Cryoendolithus antarcticus]